MLNAPLDEIVFVTNATTGTDTVLKNMVWEEGDVILQYELVYGALAKGINYVTETTPAECETMRIAWPIEDDDLVRIYEERIQKINAEGKGKRRVRMAVCDTIISTPGVRVPFERLVKMFHANGVLSLVDGAHGIGHIPIDLGALKPDFFVSNLHKWFYLPRGCAVLHIPAKNQHLIRTSLPTSHSFKPKPRPGQDAIDNPLPTSTDPYFVELFDFVGTTDNSNYLCVAAAMQFRNQVCGGEGAVQSYNISLARKAGDELAKILGTDVMDNKSGSLRDCAFSNIRLPIEIGDQDGQVRQEHAGLVSEWMKEASQEFNTMFQIFLYQGSWWWRISAQVYLEMEDFLMGVEIAKVLCEKVRRREYLSRKIPA